MFIRGANWVPADAMFGRITESMYHHLLTLASQVNVNMFRVWGGGIREKAAFYDYCDQHGILLWQEFPFACANYPKDPKSLQIVETETIPFIRNIRNHPAIYSITEQMKLTPFIISILWIF